MISRDLLYGGKKNQEMPSVQQENAANEPYL